MVLPGVDLGDDLRVEVGSRAVGRQPRLLPNPGQGGRGAQHAEAGGGRELSRGGAGDDERLSTTARGALSYRTHHPFGRVFHTSGKRVLEPW